MRITAALVSGLISFAGLGALPLISISPAAASTCGASPSATPAPTGSAQRPSDVLDLADWYVTLPTGADEKPDTVRQPKLDGYSSAWFKLDGTRRGVVFTANAGGTTTSGSGYPRSELREMDGTEKAAWSNKSGVHTMRIREAVTALPPVKPEVVTAQIHDSSDDVMEIRLEGTKLIAQYDDGKRDIVLDPTYKLGEVFDVEIVAAQSRVDVRYTGVDSKSAATIDRSGAGWYFKAGSYVQSNTSRGDKSTAVGTVVIYSLDVEHTS